MRSPVVSEALEVHEEVVVEHADLVDVFPAGEYSSEARPRNLAGFPVAWQHHLKASQHAGQAAGVRGLQEFAHRRSGSEDAVLHLAILAFEAGTDDPGVRMLQRCSIELLECPGAYERVAVE